MSYTAFIALLVIGSGSYLAWCLVTRRPERTLYAYLLLWAFFPKAARVIYFAPQAEDWPEGITVYTTLEALAFVGIAAAVLKRSSNRLDPETRPIRWYAYLLAATGILSVAVPVALQQFPDQINAAGLWTFISDTVQPQWRWMGASSLVYGAIFAFGCIEFLRTRKQIETAFLIFILSGFELAAEAILLYLLHLAPSLESWVVKTHRFNSLTYNAYDMVGLMSVLTIGALLYFAAINRSARMLLVLPILLLPVILTFERAPLLGIGAELCVAAWLLGGRWRFYAFAGAGLATLLLVLTNIPILPTVTAALGQDVRPDYLSSETAHGRLGLYLRGLDAIVFLFPFGAGPGMLRVAMASMAPETLVGLNTAESLGTYADVASGRYVTASHNALIEFVGENGLMGLLTAGAFLFIVVRNLTRWRNLKTEGYRDALFERVLQSTVYAMLLGVAVFCQFEAMILPHALNVMLLWFTCLPFTRAFARDAGGGAMGGTPVDA